MRITRIIKLLIIGFVILAGVNIIFSIMSTSATANVITARNMRRVFALTIYDLRTTSLDFTRMARAYIVMGQEYELEAYHEQLVTQDRLGGIRQTFVENNATAYEIYLFDQALSYQSRMRAIDFQAIEMRTVGEIDLAMDLTYSTAFTAYSAAFADLVEELDDITHMRVQEMVERAERLSFLFEYKVIIIAVLFGLMSVAALVFILRGVNADMQGVRDAEEFTRKLLDNSPLMMEFWDIEGKMLDCNQKMLDSLEIKVNSELTRQFFEYSAPIQPCGQTAEELNSEMIARAKEFGHYRSEWLFILPSGEELPTESTWAYVENQGKPMIIVYSHDLRPIKAVMESEREAHELTQIILDSAPFVVCLWDDDHNIISTSKHAIEMFGVDDAQVITNGVFDYSAKVQPCGTPSLEKARLDLDEAYRNGYTCTEWLHITAKGEPLPSEVVIKCFRQRGKDMLVSYTRDLREIKAAMAREREFESAIREAGERAALMMDATPLSCFMTSWGEYDDGVYRIKALDCNQAALDLFGFTNKEEAVKRFGEIFMEPLEGTSLDAPVFSRLVKTMEQGMQRFEFTHKHPNGELIPCEITLVLTEYKGEPVLACFQNDLREIKRLEIAEEESRAKSRFLARMSHEIRTPMNAVLGIVEIQLQKKGHPPETEEAFLRIHSSSNLLLTIINDILDLSMVEAGKMEIVPVLYETEHLIMDTVQLNLMLVGSKEIEFKLFVDEDLPSALVGDELRIKQILTNLLSNAFKYTTQGFVRLAFDVEKIPDSDDTMLVMNISDTGQGMTNEQLDTLFMEFTRYNVHSNRVIEGSGLGMSIAHSLVKMMGGDIDVKSNLGEGSIFTVRIPQQPGGGSPLGKAAAEKLQNYKTNHGMLKTFENIDIVPMPHGKVLIVDDVEVNLYVAEGILAQYEIKIDTASSGREAVTKVENGEVYDIIFMDHMMPGMDGIEATRTIRSMGYTHPIVALTANAVKGASDLFAVNDFSGFISKPIDVGQLNAYLIRYIGEK